MGAKEVIRIWIQPESFALGEDLSPATEISVPITVARVLIEVKKTEDHATELRIAIRDHLRGGYHA